MDYFLRCTASVNVNVFFDSREIFGFQFALNSELIDSPCFPLLQMDITGAILCLVVVMIVSDHVTVRGEEGVCDDTPCLNGGQCIDLSYPGGPQEFKCSCREGFRGLTCQKRIEPCAEEPCFNGGSCVPNGEHYHCVCKENFEGKNCDTSKFVKETCSDKPCGAHGVCEMVNDDFICECFPGYQGPRCEKADPEVEAQAEAKEAEDGDKPSAAAAVEEKATWDIRNMLISLFVLFLLFVVVLLLLCIHCSRVYKRRTKIVNVRKARRAAGLPQPPLPGWLETSNKLCNECMCYLCLTPERDTAIRERNLVDNQTFTSQDRELVSYASRDRDYDLPYTSSDRDHKTHFTSRDREYDLPYTSSDRAHSTHFTPHDRERHSPLTPHDRERDSPLTPHERERHSPYSHRTRFTDSPEPTALYTPSPVHGKEFYAFEDPNDPRLSPNTTPNVNENKMYKNYNRNYKYKVGREPRQFLRQQQTSRKSSGRRYIYKKKQLIPINYDDDFDDDDSDEDSDEDTDDEYTAFKKAPRGLLPGFQRVTPDKKPRKPPTHYKSVPAIRENRRVIKTKHSRALSPQFPFRPRQSTWWENTNRQACIDNLDMDQSEYSAACGDTDENMGESSEDENHATTMQFDDDGYISTSRLSESDAGGRCRDPQSMHLCTEIAGQNYRARQQKRQHMCGQRPMMEWTDEGGGQSFERLNDEPEDDESSRRFIGTYTDKSKNMDSNCGEYKQIKSILKKTKATPKPKETVIHVRPGMVDGQCKPQIYREVCRDHETRSPRNLVEYKHHVNRNPHRNDFDRWRSHKRLAYPPTYPPPTYEDVAYS
ncbi:fibropellin-3 [Biomphalaria glabrata]